MPIQISAAEGGFHFRGPTGEPIAPEVFFADTFNPDGKIYQSDDEQIWRTEESFVNDAIRVEAVLAREAALPPGARANDTTELAISAFSFSRVTDDGVEQIGVMDFGAILTVSATYQPNGSAAIGGGATPNWIADVGDAIRTAFAEDGFEFRGGDGDDLFDPSTGAPGFAVTGDLRGAGGDDSLVAQNGVGDVYGGAGDDMLSAQSGIHVFWGGGGDDEIYLGELSQGQQVYAGRGADRVEGGRGDDELSGGKGRDVIFGGEGDDEIHGGGARDKLMGGEGDDLITGGGGADRLKGGFGRDTLDGGDGADKLIGGRGDDELTGGGGEDSFFFSKGADVVMDFDPLADQIVSDGASAASLNIDDSDLGAVVSFDGADGQMLLLGVFSDELSDANFLF